MKDRIFGLIASAVATTCVGPSAFMLIYMLDMVFMNIKKFLDKISRRNIIEAPINDEEALSY